MFRKTIAVLVAALMVALSGCSLFSSVDKAQLAYNVGKTVTTIYIAEQDKLPQVDRDAVTKAWELFRDNADKITAENIASFPTMLKDQASKIPNAALRDKVTALIDKYWDKLNTSMDLTGAGGVELVAVVNSLKDGIQDALAKAGLK